MAPVAPTSKRLTARQKVRARLSQTGPIQPKTFRPEAIVADGFLNSKRDKRLIKHSAFVSRISKSSESKTKKRRRPNKKLVATLESLGDALDDIADEMKGSGEEPLAQGKIRHKSLKSRPGALKRKERVIKGEMERFGRSLAQLASMPEGTGEKGVDDRDENTETEGAPQQAQAASNRWAALRGFISATMEQNPAFLKEA